MLGQLAVDNPEDVDGYEGDGSEAGVSTVHEDHVAFTSGGSHLVLESLRQRASETFGAIAHLWVVLSVVGRPVLVKGGDIAVMNSAVSASRTRWLLLDIGNSIRW